MKILAGKNLLAPALMGILMTGCGTAPDSMRSALDSAGEHYRDTTGEPLTVEGVVSKGMMYHAPMEIYSLAGPDLGSPIGSGRTDEFGHFSITIPRYVRTPLYIRVMADSNTTMRCDLVMGCGENIEFGEVFPFTDSEFQLDAAMPAWLGDDSVGVNVSLLTDLAARRARHLATLQADIDELIRQANAMVASRFSLPSPLYSIPLFDITVFPYRLGWSDWDLRYNLFNSAIMGSMFNDGASSFASGLSALRNQYVTGPGIADFEVTNSTAFTMEELYTQMLALTNRIAVSDTSGRNWSSFITELEADRLAARNGSSEPSHGDPTVPPAAGLDKAKAMVAEVRKLATGIESGFDAQAQLVETALDRDASDVFRAMSMSAQAIGAAWAARQENTALTSFEHDKTGLTVAISGNSTATTYTVDDEDISFGNDAVSVSLSATDTGSSLTEEATDDGKAGSAQADLKLVGSATSSALLLDVAAGSLVLEGLQASGTSVDAVTGQFERLVLDLDVLMEDAESAEDPVTFDGNIGIDVTNAAGQRDDANEEEELTAETVKVSLAGNFSAQSGESLFGSVVINLESGDIPLNRDETADNYVPANFTAILRVNSLGEINVPTQLTLNGTRTGLESALATVKVAYGAVNLSSEYNFQVDGQTPTEIVIRDQNGVVLTLKESADKISGSVTLNGTQHATISEVNGFPRVAYTDGTNETLW